MSGDQRQAIIVAGMHRSGTSALTRVINILGADLPSNLLGSNHSNRQGHWESNELIEIHDLLLRSAGSNWNSVLEIQRDWFDTAEAKGFSSRIAKFLDHEFPNSSLVVIKDPRIALFIPVWLEALGACGIEARVVLPFRHPFEVAASLSRREAISQPSDVWSLGRGLALWLRYVLAAERTTRACPRAFVDFDVLLHDWQAEMARIGGQIGLHWPREFDAVAPEVEQFLSREHKHETRAEDDPDLERISSTCADVLQLLTDCLEAPQGDRERFDDAWTGFRKGTEVFGGYLNALEVEASARGQALSEGRQTLAALEHELRLAHDAATSERTNRDLAEARLAALEASTSWKLTGPLRSAVEWTRSRRS